IGGAIGHFAFYHRCPASGCFGLKKLPRIVYCVFYFLVPRLKDLYSHCGLIRYSSPFSCETKIAREKRIAPKLFHCGALLLVSLISSRIVCSHLSDRWYADRSCSLDDSPTGLRD